MIEPSTAPAPAERPRPPVRLFRSHALERLTHTSVATILAFWIPVFVLCLVIGVDRGGFGAAKAATLFLAGAAAWTLFEYLLHRFVFHIERWIPPARRNGVSAPVARTRLRPCWVKTATFT